MALIGDQPLHLHQTGYPSNRIKHNDSDEQQLASLASSFKQTPTRLSAPPIPIYSGPGEGYGSTYFCMLGAGDTYDHSIYFKGDKFTVREDRQLWMWIEEEDKHKRPVDDTTIRSVWDPRNKEFLESLMKEECPAEFSEGRQGNHYIHIYGLHDDQDLKEPSTPPHCSHSFSLFEGLCI